MDAQQVVGLLDSDVDSVASYNSENVELLELSEGIASPQQDSTMVRKSNFFR